MTAAPNGLTYIALVRVERAYPEPKNQGSYLLQAVTGRGKLFYGSAGLEAARGVDVELTEGVDFQVQDNLSLSTIAFGKPTPVMLAMGSLQPGQLVRLTCLRTYRIGDGRMVPQDNVVDVEIVPEKGK